MGKKYIHLMLGWAKLIKFDGNTSGIPPTQVLTTCKLKTKRTIVSLAIWWFGNLRMNINEHISLCNTYQNQINSKRLFDISIVFPKNQISIPQKKIIGQDFDWLESGLGHKAKLSAFKDC